MHTTKGATFTQLDLAICNTMRVHIVASARKHGIHDSDINHAVRHALRTFDLDGYTILVGPDKHANLLELAVTYEYSTITVFHAMPARPKYFEVK
jgi:hypothetical protein